MEAQIDGQIDFYGYLNKPKKTLNDYWDGKNSGKKIHLTSDELFTEQEKLGKNAAWYFNTDTKHKCCGCFPMLQETSGIAPKDYCECIVCGRKTKPLYDYSWMETKRRWEALFEPEQCFYEEHECKEEELWVEAKSRGIDCPETCCNHCGMTICPVRCLSAKKKILLKGMKMITRKMREEAIYKIAEYTNNIPSKEKDIDWNLAEIKKYSYVREYADRKSGITDYIYSAYGYHDGTLDYYSIRTSTNEIFSGEKAKETFHKSKTWYK